MGVLILGVNTLYRRFCFFRLFLRVGKGLIFSDLIPLASRIFAKFLQFNPHLSSLHLQISNIPTHSGHVKNDAIPPLHRWISRQQRHADAIESHTDGHEDILHALL